VDDHLDRDGDQSERTEPRQGAEEKRRACVRGLGGGAHLDLGGDHGRGRLRRLRAEQEQRDPALLDRRGELEDPVCEVEAQDQPEGVRPAAHDARRELQPAREQGGDLPGVVERGRDAPERAHELLVAAAADVERVQVVVRPAGALEQVRDQELAERAGLLAQLLLELVGLEGEAALLAARLAVDACRLPEDDVVGGERPLRRGQLHGRSTVRAFASCSSALCSDRVAPWTWVVFEA
jgi:hypothetical protein